MIRTGIFGGTFDPVHYGHIRLAETAYNELSLDKVIFMPAYIPPHKADNSVSDWEHRVNMLKLAISDIPYFNISFLEKELQEHPKEMTENFNPEAYTGEEEVDALCNIIEDRGGIATYTLISNQGTENECENEVVLMKKQADVWTDNIREKNNGSDMLIQEGDIILKDIKGDEVDLFFVDEICFKADETI